MIVTPHQKQCFRRFSVVCLFACLSAILLVSVSCTKKNPIGHKVQYIQRNYNGIDVSHHQGKIDWELVAQDTCIKFVYIKATQGGSYKDPEYKRNIKGAQKQGLKCGSYHYFTMLSKAKDQFDNFKKATKRYVQDLIPVVDVELNHHDKNGWRIDGCHTGKNMPKERERVILTLKNLLELFEKEYGCKPIIYCSYSSYVQVIEGNFDDYPIFFGNYAKKPRLKDYLIWQFTQHGHVNGIHGYVDLNVFHKGVSLTDLTLELSK